MSTPHPYADILHAIADGKIIQLNSGKGWANITIPSALTLISNIRQASPLLRIAPETIAINGIEVPKPESVAPSKGADYYMPGLEIDSICYRITWDGDSVDVRRLARGLVHLTREAAEQHGKAFISASGGTL